MSVGEESEVESSKNPKSFYITNKKIFLPVFDF